MIVRIVKMYLQSESRDDFLELFERTKDAIRAFDGCLHLELLHDSNDPDCLVTLSHWRDKHDLNEYRNSELFNNVWSRVKPMFKEKAEAISLEPMGQ